MNLVANKPINVHMPSFRMQLERGVYWAGEIVRGHILFNVGKPKKIRGVRVRFDGYSMCEWYESETYRDYNGELRTRQVRFYGPLPLASPPAKPSNFVRYLFQLVLLISTLLLLCLVTQEDQAKTSTFKATLTSGPTNSSSLSTCHPPSRVNTATTTTASTAMLISLGLPVRCSINQTTTFLSFPFLSFPLLYFKSSCH